jgi:hypothetical protein
MIFGQALGQRLHISLSADGHLKQSEWQKELVHR